MTGGNWNGKDIGSEITGASASNTSVLANDAVPRVNEVGDQRDACTEQTLIKFNYA